MALTMTRTRTQKALTDLSKMVANVHGELEFVEWALQYRRVGRAVLARRRAELVGQREALYTTLRVFNPELDPATVGYRQEWLRPFGRKASPAAVRRYIRIHGAAACLETNSTSALPAHQFDCAEAQPLGIGESATPGPQHPPVLTVTNGEIDQHVSDVVVRHSGQGYALAGGSDPIGCIHRGRV